jgi:hypothetical protein
MCEKEKGNMKTKMVKITLVGLVTIMVIGWLGYLASQQPKIWCNRQGAGIILLKGGYRSWTMRFCDGEAFIDGKMQPVVITPTGCRKGYFWRPQFGHLDVRGLVTE